MTDNEKREILNTIIAMQLALIDEQDLNYTTIKSDYNDGYIKGLDYARSELIKVYRILTEEIF